MNKLTLIAAFLFLAAYCSGQESEKKVSKLPSVVIKTVDGKEFNTKNIANDGKPVILSFWATWCKPCLKELTTISDNYEDWREETGVKLVAVSIDDSRSSSKVGTTVDGKGWEFEVLLDPNGDFKRAMNVNLIPHTFILDGNMEVVWQHTSFSEGSELELIELIRKLNKGESISDK
jgi:peroxiredoxin